MNRDEIALSFAVALVANMNSEARRRYEDGKADGREMRQAYALADAFLAASVEPKEQAD